VEHFDRLLNKRIVLVTGKGGVGRSTVTAAIAMAASRQGKRVLLTEMGDLAGADAQSPIGYSPLARLFGRDHLPVGREEIAPGLFGSLLLPLKGHELFLASVFRVSALARAALSSEALRRLFQAAPSLREVGIFYHLLTYLREVRKDGGFTNELIVVDMPATGHALALTGLPRTLIGMVSRGPIADALREGQSYLNDPKQSATVVVTLPEMLPVSETIELLEGLKASNMPNVGVVVNRMSPDPFSADERAALEVALRGNANVLGAEGFRYFEECRRALDRLLREVTVPVIKLPEAPAASDSLVPFLADCLVLQ
jgi:arsenite-transporting ATPase